MAFVWWAGFIVHQCYIAPRGHGETMPALPGLFLCSTVISLTGRRGLFPAVRSRRMLELRFFRRFVFAVSAFVFQILHFSFYLVSRAEPF